MTKDFEIFLTCLRFLAFKITDKYYRIYLKINGDEVYIVVFFKEGYGDLEIELFDDIVTNTKAHLPYHAVIGDIREKGIEINDSEFDFLLFSFYEEYEEE